MDKCRKSDQLRQGLVEKTEDPESWKKSVGGTNEGLVGGGGGGGRKERKVSDWRGPNALDKKNS